MVSGAAGEDDAIAPMTGTVTAVYSEAGAQVQKGDLLMTIVAMKMEHAIKAPKDGIIKQILVNQGEVNIEINKGLPPSILSLFRRSTEKHCWFDTKSKD